jgi:hypothetical protein
VCLCTAPATLNPESLTLTLNLTLTFTLTIILTLAVTPPTVTCVQACSSTTARCRRWRRGTRPRTSLAM